MRDLLVASAFVGWLAGIVIAKGFISTTIAIIFPFWAYYLVIERVLERLF